MNVFTDGEQHLEVANFNKIPFARSPRLSKPVSYGKWEGTLDGTGNTPMVPQNDGFMEKLDQMEGQTFISKAMFEKLNAETIMDDEVLHLSVYTPSNFKSTSKVGNSDVSSMVSYTEFRKSQLWSSSTAAGSSSVEPLLTTPLRLSQSEIASLSRSGIFSSYRKA